MTFIISLMVRSSPCITAESLCHGYVSQSSETCLPHYIKGTLQKGYYTHTRPHLSDAVFKGLQMKEEPINHSYQTPWTEAVLPAQPERSTSPPDTRESDCRASRHNKRQEKNLTPSGLHWPWCGCFTQCRCTNKGHTAYRSQGWMNLGDGNWLWEASHHWWDVRKPQVSSANPLATCTL